MLHEVALCYYFTELRGNLLESAKCGIAKDVGHVASVTTVSTLMTHRAFIREEPNVQEPIRPFGPQHEKKYRRGSTTIFRLKLLQLVVFALQMFKALLADPGEVRGCSTNTSVGFN